MLQNAAKYGKLMENYGNFGGAELGAAGEDVSHERTQDDSLDQGECCKNQMMAEENMAIPGFPAFKPGRTSGPPGGISCT